MEIKMSLDEAIATLTQCDRVEVENPTYGDRWIVWSKGNEIVATGIYSAKVTFDDFAFGRSEAIRLKDLGIPKEASEEEKAYYREKGFQPKTSVDKDVEGLDGQLTLDEVVQALRHDGTICILVHGKDGKNYIGKFFKVKGNLSVVLTDDL